MDTAATAAARPRACGPTCASTRCFAASTDGENREPTASATAITTVIWASVASRAKKRVTVWVSMVIS